MLILGHQAQVDSSGIMCRMNAALASVTLRRITPTNRSAIESLSVTAEQQNYVDGVAESLLEAANTPDARPWYRAAYLGDVPVGFVMLVDGIPDGHPVYLGPYFLWRLLVDLRYQGQGHGSQILDQVVDYVRTRPCAERLLTSAVPGERSPVGFYLKYGFRLTGEVDDGEAVMELPLSPITPMA